jgi:TolA-binding protein
LKTGRFFSFSLISLFIVLTACIFPCSAQASNKSVPGSQDANKLADESLSIQEVGGELVNVAIEEYNKALFEAAYKSLLKAKKVEGYLSAEDKDKLNKYIPACEDAINKRKQALEQIRTAKKNLQDEQLLQAKAHLTEVVSSPYLTASEKETVAASVKKIDTLLAGQQKQTREIYNNSVKLYKAGKLTEAREGFIKVAQSGQLELPSGSTAEDYIHKIDIAIGKETLPAKTAIQQPPLTKAPPKPIITKPAAADINKTEVSIPVIPSAKTAPTPAPKPQTKNTVAEGYLIAVMKDTLDKVTVYLNKGDIPSAQICVENTEKILNENRQYLNETTYNNYIEVLNSLKSRWQQ